MLSNTSAFCPDWKSSPGDTIIELLDEKELSIEGFSKLINKTTSFASGLVSGKEPITHEVALRLSETLGASVDFWLARESDYRAITSETIQPTDPIEWYRLLPLSDMKKFGWITRAKSSQDIACQCLEFFGVSTVPQWINRYGADRLGPAYRKSKTYNTEDYATLVWLRRAELISKNSIVNEWDSEKLQELIPVMRKLTWFKDPSLFISKVELLLAKAGVRFALVKAPKGCTASGAAWFLNDGSPLIQVSFRYLSDDQFWFTLFHEIAHLLLHEDHLPFYEIKGMEIDDFESEANAFASSVIVPPHLYSEFIELPPSSRSVMNFAKKSGIAPGLIVGQMQYNNMIKYSQLNFLKRRFQWL